MKNYTPKAMRDRLIRACDRLWRRIVLMRVGCECEICGAPRTSRISDGKVIWVQACHIISRTYWSTRWDPKNGVAGCLDCHDHKTIMAWLEETDPERYDWVMEQKQRQVPHRDIDLHQIRENLRRTA